MTNQESEDEYYNLGKYGRKIDTKSADAQLWFDRGLVWVYAFNHDEAALCFERATKADPECAIAYWGLAYSLGPNYNKPWELFDKEDLKNTLDRTAEACERAKKYVTPDDGIGKGLVDAVASRYDRNVEPDVRNQNYADAMSKVYAQYGNDDLDIATLYADALMNLTPWELWDDDKPNPKAKTFEIKDVLESALKTPSSREHPGILHMYIHLMEMSPNPELALNAADCLRGLVPDAGHLNHMPSHLDVLVGDYRRAIASNQEATLNDELYVHKNGVMNFYSLYRMHDYHSLIYAAMFAGQKRIAMETVDRMEATLPEKLLRMESPPMADWLETFLSVRAHVMIRFGMWSEIIEMEFPQDQELYCVTTATTHYAKGVALAAIGNVAEAERARVAFKEAVARVPENRHEYPNKASDILAIASEMLDGEIEYRKGNFDAAFKSLKRSIELDDNLIYSEPKAWMQPSRHAYAALKTEQGYYEEAAAIYRADLGFDNTLGRIHQHPNNVWSLVGYHECLVRLGREVEAGLIEPQMRIAKAVADVPVKSSCFCKRDS